MIDSFMLIEVDISGDIVIEMSSVNALFEMSSLNFVVRLDQYARR